MSGKTWQVPARLHKGIRVEVRIKFPSTETRYLTRVSAASLRWKEKKDDSCRRAAFRTAGGGG